MKEKKSFSGSCMFLTTSSSSFLALILLLNCCSFSDRMEEKKRAEKVALLYYFNLKEHHEKDVLPLIGKQFFRHTNITEIKQLISSIYSQLGDVKYYQLISYSAWENTSTQGSGSYFKLIYHVEYTKCASRETLDLFREKGEEEIKIIGLGINTPCTFLAQEKSTSKDASP